MLCLVAATKLSEDYSLSFRNIFLLYDIIKAHGAKIKVETKEGEGAEFVIELSTKEK